MAEGTGLLLTISSTLLYLSLKHVIASLLVTVDMGRRPYSLMINRSIHIVLLLKSRRLS